MLADQGWNDILTTSNWCGRSYPTQGIPSLVADRWVDPGTGTVTVADKAFGQDVRPCNDRAEVSFAHKTGFTFNFLADAGIVEPLPDHPQRQYVVAVLTNLGSRFADRRFVESCRPAPAGSRAGAFSRNPAGAPARRAPYTEQLAILGRSIHRLFPLEATGEETHAGRSGRGT
jgi:hypothetical protein